MDSTDIVYFDNVRINYQVPVPKSYVVQLAQPIPSGYSLTNPLPSPNGVHTASFTVSGEGDCQNNFGLAVADLAIVKTVNTTTPKVGESVIFTIEAQNNGPLDATGVEVSDVLPAGYTLTDVSMSSGTWVYPNWNIGNMANGASETLQLTATVNTSGPYSNTAIITGSQPDPFPDDNDSTAITYPIPVADLKVEKLVNDIKPNIGDTVNFTIQAINLGPSTATGITVSDILPTGYTFINASPSKGIWSSPNWTMDSLILGDTQSVVISARVLSSGDYNNVASITGNEEDPDTLNNITNRTLTPQLADLSIEISASDTNVFVRDIVTIYVTLKNDGPDTATSVSLQNIVPNGFTNIVNINSGGILVNDTIRWTGITLAPGDSLIFSYETKMASTGPGIEYTTISEVTDADQFDPDSSPNNWLSSEDDYDLLSLIVSEEPPMAINDESPDNTVGADVTLNIIANDSLSDGTNIVDLTDITVDLDPSTPGIQDSLIVPGEGRYDYDTLTGEVTFNPEAGFTTDPTPIMYTLIENATGLDSTATITITYTEEPPVAVNDESNDNIVGIDVTLNIIANDSLSDGTNIVDLTDITVDLDPSTPGIQDSLIVPGEGRYDYDTLTGEVTFNPEAGFTTDPTPIMYTLIENATGLDGTATITITYSEEPPVAVNDESSDNIVGIDVTLNIIANDSLSDGTNIVDLTDITIDLDPSTPGIQDSLIVPGEGRYEYDTLTGEVTFNPEAGFTTDPTPIMYTLIENATGLDSTATITITYTEEPPVAVNDESNDNIVGIDVTLNIIANDSLSDGTPVLTLSVAELTVDLDPSTPGIQDSLIVPGEGRYDYDTLTGEVTFNPEAGFTTDPTPIDYTLIENSTGLDSTATITITYTEEPPVAVNDSSLDNRFGTKVYLNIIANDSLSDASTIISLSDVQVDIDLSTPGLQDTLVVAGQGEWVYNSLTGIISFDPFGGFIGDPDVISYLLIEVQTGLSDTANIMITYLPEECTVICVPVQVTKVSN